VLNKTDLVGPEHIEVIREWIGLHKEPLRIIETVYCAIPLEVLVQRLSLQVVGGRMQITDLDEWGKRPRVSEIVAIGSEIDGQHLDETFRACRADT